MRKLALMLVSTFITGSAGLVLAQDATPVAGAPTPSVSAKEMAHPRIHEVKDRLRDQRKRIDQGLKDKTLTKEQAKGCREVLKSVETQMKSDYKTNNSKKLTEDQTAALNRLLDANSTILHEEKQESAQATVVSNSAATGVSQ